MKTRSFLSKERIFWIPMISIMTSIFLTIPIKLTFDLSLLWSSYAYNISFVMLYYIYVRKKEKKYNYTLLVKCLSAFIGILCILSRELLYYEVFFEDWYIFDSIFTLLTRVALFVSQAYVFARMIADTIIFLSNGGLNKKRTERNFIQRLFDKNNFKSLYFFHVATILPYLLLSYPGVIIEDPYYQILQYFGIKNSLSDRVILISNEQMITAHHNSFITYLLGGVCDLSVKLLGNINLFYVLSILTTLFMIYAIDSIFSYIKSQVKNDYAISILFMIICFHPFFTTKIICTEKDIIFCSFFLLFLLEYVKYIRGERYHIIRMLLCLSVSSILRNNAYLSMMIVFFLLFLSCRKHRKMYALFVICVLCSLGTYKQFNVMMKIPNGSVAEMLSVPFQQTARYVKYYPEDVREREKHAIANILPYDQLAELYNPIKSDPVKDHYNKYASSDDLKQYHKAWFQMFQRHPFCYIEATLSNSLGYFTPYSKIYMDKPFEKTQEIYDLLNSKGILVRQSVSFAVVGEYVQLIQRIIHILPIINLPENSCIYVFIMLYVFMQTLYQKKRKYVGFLLLQVIYFCTFLPGPVNGGLEFRYLYQIMFTLPIFYLIYEENVDHQIN